MSDLCCHLRLLWWPGVGYCRGTCLDSWPFCGLVFVSGHGLIYHWRPYGCQWSMLQPEAMLIVSRQWCFRDDISVGGQNCHLDPWWCPSLSCSWGTCLGPWPHYDWVCVKICGQCYHKNLHNVCGLCCSIKPCWCTWVMLPPAAILIWVPCAVTQGQGGVLILPDIEIHDYVCILTVAGCVLMSLACVVIECWVYIPGLCCDWKLCWFLWSHLHWKALSEFLALLEQKFCWWSMWKKPRRSP